jgi:heme A synthase
MKLNRFALYAWGALGYNILVILWGTFVRATGSGAGCGKHWPACNGQVIPWSAQTETLIEFTHRVTSGLALIAIIALFIGAYRVYPKGHLVRLGAGLSLLFIITEALFGAALVLFELVGNDDSTPRAVMVAIHLINTFFLIGSLTLTAWWASGGVAWQWRGQGWLAWALSAGFLALMLLGASGAVIALGDTLFPASSLAEGLQQKFSPTAHFLIQLRPYHPLIAIGVGIYLITMAGIFNKSRPTPTTKLTARMLTVLYLVQFIVGAFNVILLAPVWMQLVHLLLSDMILVIWTLFTANVLGQNSPYLKATPVLENTPTPKQAYF